MLSDYCRLLTNSSGFSVASSHFFEVLKDMHRIKCFDVGRVCSTLGMAGVSPQFEKLAMPIWWKDRHWSCAVIDNTLGRIHHFDSQGTRRNNEVFDLLQWFLSHVKPDRKTYTVVEGNVQATTPMDSGIATMYVLRCLTLHTPPKWKDSDFSHIRKLIIFELKRGLLTPPSP